MKQKTTTGLALALCLLGTPLVQADDGRMTLGAVAGTTGLGVDLAWRYNERFGVSARYTGGIEWNTDYSTDDVNYDGDVNLAGGKLTLDYYPFTTGFFLSAGLMLPDIDADIVGRPRNATYRFNGQEYPVDALGTLNGKVTLADGVQPYAGLGWRQSHRSGFGIFAEVGVIPTDPDVSLRTSEGYENWDNPISAQLREEIRQEEKRLKDEAEKWPVYPVAVLGVSYTF
ncbi:hypothetical protein [Billgrantia saliphila]|uniref:hypothetical protein n=1 Tax=Billgrantia saliphila TaxID=1848458 RepID=UPI000CE52448|nr:hypothetical protein [Halomonas saliphila]